jgi:malate/lactate dehydrogenase
VKITIVGGAGVVGSAAAFRIAQEGEVDEIVLVDSRRNLAEAHALDIEQSVVHRSNTRVSSGEIENTQNSDLIIMTAGVPHRSTVTSRSEFLSENLPLILNLTEALLTQSPSAIWMMVSVPVDSFVYLVHKRFSIPRHKIIGLNRNDSSRFRWAISKTLSVPPTAVEAYVLGEHGETQVPVFSHIRIHGKKVYLNPDQVQGTKKVISGFFAQWNRLQPGRTAGWNSAESIGDVVASLNAGDGKYWACSTPLEGEYGLSDVSLGVPVRMGPEGVREILQLELDSSEMNALEISAKAVREQIQYGQDLITKLVI